MTGAPRDKRDLIHRHIRENPGLLLGDISSGTGIPKATLAYHVNKLVRENKVKHRASSRRKRYFAVGYTEVQAGAICALRTATPRAILGMLLDSPGTSFSGMASSIQKSRSTVSACLKSLSDSGLVGSKLDGMTRVYFVRDGDTVREMLDRYFSS
ncbi:uncharacterized protein conserved in archaea [Cenarchaeum symbiosum A]|uniref:Uncharacterized protein conserved in archaea n=1 Tax=Cenarchaeum symbiosum (strain A) TaxID=414004 RepID=A0RTN0_CENSY|nr:uncharacterized protein conserved in archaea [Cenarchaeum symbiosum A]